MLPVQLADTRPFGTAGKFATGQYEAQAPIKAPHVPLLQLTVAGAVGVKPLLHTALHELPEVMLPVQLADTRPFGTVGKLVAGQ